MIEFIIFPQYLITIKWFYQKYLKISKYKKKHKKKFLQMLLIPSEEKTWYESNWFWRLSSDSCGGAAGLLTGRLKFLYWLLEMKWQCVQVEQNKPVAWDCSLYRPPMSTERSASCWSFFLPLSCEQCGHDKAEKGTMLPLWLLWNGADSQFYIC